MVFDHRPLKSIFPSPQGFALMAASQVSDKLSLWLPEFEFALIRGKLINFQATQRLNPSAESQTAPMGTGGEALYVLVFPPHQVGGLDSWTLIHFLYKRR